MPLPLVPLLPLAGAALAAVAIGRAFRAAIRPVRIDQRGEDALDGIDEGIGAARVPARKQASASGRLRRVLRFADGSGLEIDAAFLARLRLRKV